jgi:hypothetical protein
MLDAAVGSSTESIVGPLAGGTVTETHYGLSSDVLVLRQVPVGAGRRCPVGCGPALLVRPTC